MQVRLDHLAVSARSLAEGARHVETALGVTLEGGGRHAAMGTHNRLLSLGPEVYLEVIAVDPDAPPPGRPRWFDLDRFAGPPHLTNWILQTDDLAAARGVAPDGTGEPMPLARGDLRWTMAVPGDGRLPFDGVFPALIEWHGQGHPARRLSDAGCRLASLEIAHPDAAGLTRALTRLGDLPLVRVVDGPAAIRAVIDTPSGRRSL